MKLYDFLPLGLALAFSRKRTAIYTHSSLRSVTYKISRFKDKLDSRWDIFVDILYVKFNLSGRPCVGVEHNLSIRPESFEHQSAAFSDCFFWLAMDTSDAQARKNIVSDARCCYSIIAASGYFKICIICAF